MATVRITLPIRSRRIKQEVNRDLYWYDAEKKTMCKFSGTRLDFEYVYDETIDEPKYRLLPKVVVSEEYIVVKSRDKKDIIDWFRDYQTYNNTEADLQGGIVGKTATFEVPDDELDKFLEDLEDNGFQPLVL